MSVSRRSAVGWLLYPGMQLMQRLRLPAKTAVMGTLMLVPLAWITAQALLASYGGLDSTRQESAGTPLIKQLLELAAQTQKHRGLVNRSLAGDTTVATALNENRTALEAAARTLDETLAHVPEFELAREWAPIRTGVRQALDAEKDPNSFKLHTGLVEQQRVFLSRCAEASGLLLDPEAAPFHLMHLAVEPVVPWTEALGQLRGRGAAFLRKGEMSVADNAALAAQLQLLRQATANAQMISGALERSGEKLPDGLQRALDSSAAYLQLTEATFSTLAPKGDPAAYFDAGTKAIKDAVDVGTSTADRLQTLLDERMQRLRRQWLQQWGVGLGTVFLVAYLSAAFFRNSFAAVRSLQEAVSVMANGDFATPVKLRATDELCVVAETLEGMTARLSEMVADIRSHSTLVAQAGFQLSDATKALSDRTVAQAAGIEKTGSSVQRLSEAVRANAQGAEAASGRAATVRAIAEQGGTAIQSAVTSMQDIQASSAKVQEIVGVIEGIAFQTNILALNAAVEAARAGEQGRGFGVVASEVRSLAQRSAASAKEIKSLIAASAENVATGVRQIGGASSTFAEIVSGIREVAQSLQVIGTHTAEQTVGLDHVASAVKEIDDITHQNSRMVETAFRDSAQLTERADHLAAAVESFRLRQGSADEAVALVKQAGALLASGGTSALAQISAAGSAFADRDMYVFAFDRQGLYRAFGGNPEKVGSLVSANPGVDARKLVADAFDQVDRGGGWVDYQITHPVTGQVHAKTSYVQAAGQDLLLGCGVYKARDFGAAPPSRVRSTESEAA